MYFVYHLYNCLFLTYSDSCTVSDHRRSCTVSDHFYDDGAFFCRFWKRLASLYSHHVLVVITVVYLPMGHVAVARRTSCLEQIKAKVSCHGFVKTFSKELHVMMMTHLSELKSGIIFLVL